MTTKTTLDEIKLPIAAHLVEFEKSFSNVMKSRVPLLDIILRYMYRQKGKQLRPIFVFLSAGVFGIINERTQRAAALIELLHTATLVHDDVVDDSHKRRGFFSINALWKNKIAVLAGDYLLSKGLLLSLDNDDFDLLRIVSEATREMSEGELLQIEKARRLDISEEVYFEIIRKKTASLIASCCKAGSASVGADAQMQDRMYRFGENVGIAFQIKDDLFDYQANNKTGKPSASDIKEKKMTLPLIYTLNNSDYTTKTRLKSIVKYHSTNAAKVSEVIETVEKAGGIEYAGKRMIEYRDKALEILASFHPSSATQALEKLVYFTIDREK
ncbi:MAG: polyprenyl synthetase family protein [Bacteroidales bacterium]|nr:polyprenyl synthetase family protein [Bacteroidales bacterium]MDZ4205413.1 polyprenyl synthetase family protein [Bacteroidales bacterium]